MKCKVCLEKKAAKNKKFCSDECRKLYYLSDEFRQKAKIKALKQWEGNFERKQKMSKRVKSYYLDNPNAKEKSQENIKKANKKLDEIGRSHTEEFKKNLGIRSKLRIRTQEEKDKIKKNHWSTTLERDNIIASTRQKVWGDKEKTNKSRAKMSETRANKIASGEIKLLSGKSGFYFSFKNNCYERYDSLYELHKMKEYDSDHSILSWTKKHKIVIKYEFANITKRYVPDFLLVKENESIIEEIKSPWSHSLWEQLNELKQQAAIEYCSQNNYKFSWQIINLTYEQIKQL